MNNIVARLRRNANIVLPGGFLVNNGPNGCTVTRFPEDYEMMDANGNVISKPALQPSPPHNFYLKRYLNGDVEVLLCPDGCLHVQEEMPL